MSLSNEFNTPPKKKLSDSGSPKDEPWPNASESIQQPVTATPTTPQSRRKGLQITSAKYISRTLPPMEPTNFDSTDVTHSCIATEPVFGLLVPIIEHLDLPNFKVKPCLINTQHNHKHCPFFHNAKDRKRLGFFYSADLCEYAEKEILLCPAGEACVKSHNRVEQLYRPEKYKTKFCTFYPNNLEKCEYGHFCSFAHSENDILIELIHNYEYDDDFYMFHFKTIWCPFNLTQHDKALCVYAHNWQDYRRRPDQNNYEANPCSNWKSTDFILNYEDGCPFRDKCNKCHGWKEHEYHPFNYRVKPCTSGKNCQKGRDCPHYHTSREKRALTPHILNRIFKFVPRNRIITNTFKVRSDEKVQYANLASPQTSIFNTSTTASPFKNYETLSEQVLDPQSSYGISTPQPVYVQSLNDLGQVRPENTLQKPRRSSFDLPNQPYEEQQIPQIIEEKMQIQELPMENQQSMETQQVKENFSKPPGIKRWSTQQEQRLQADNDRMFREIIFSPEIKSKKEKEIARARRKIRTAEEGDQAEHGSEQNELDEKLLQKILEN